MNDIMSWPGVWWANVLGWLITIIVVALILRPAWRALTEKDWRNQ